MTLNTKLTFCCRMGVQAPKLNIIQNLDVVALMCYKFVSSVAAPLQGNMAATGVTSQKSWRDASRLYFMKY